jgi:hypothetical protein
MNKFAHRSRVALAGSLTLGLVVCGYAPALWAQKIERDPTVSSVPVPPKLVPPPPSPVLPRLSAAQIVDKNVAARGGAAKWHAVQAITMSGQMDAGGKVPTSLPYTWQMKRPNKQRLAIEFAGQTALQIFDGVHGWKLRPFLNRGDAEPYSAEELEKTAESQGLDGPLVDYAAKGNKIELDGTENVDGVATYRLKLINKQGHTSHIWINGTTFLEAKVEGHPRRFDGVMREVDTYMSDYRSVDGLLIPYAADTRVQGVKSSHKMTVEKVALNPKLDDALFAKPASVPIKQKVFALSNAPSATRPNADTPGTPGPEAPTAH